MAPRRRAADQSTPWWHARAGFIWALVFAPSVWLAVVSFVGRTYDRIGNAERDIQALQRDVSRLDVELRESRRH